MPSVMDRTSEATSATSPRTDADRRFWATKVAFMVASFLSLALSVTLWAIGNQTQAIFVGLWVPSIHSLGTLVLTGERTR